MSDDTAHLDQVTLQGYLDHDLGAEARARTEVHLAACARCRAELAGWRTLFGGLEGLPELSPPVGFSGRVISALPDARPSHATPEELQELAEGRLPAAARARLDAHLAQCPACTSEMRGWQALHAALDRLPRLAPSPAFAARVLEAVAPRPVEAGTASPLEGLRALASGWIPRPGLGRRLAAGALFAPVLGLFIIAALVVLNPMFEPGDLLTFAGWQLSDLWQIASSQVFQLVTETSLLLWSSGIVDALTGSPVLALAGLAGIWMAIVSSGWILYRNVVAPSGRPRHHVALSR